MADIETKYGKIHFSHSNVITRIVNKAVESCEGRVILQNYKGGLNAGSIDIVECEEGYQLKVYVVIRFGAGIKKCTSEIINSIYENTEKILWRKAAARNGGGYGNTFQKHRQKTYRGETLMELKDKVTELKGVGPKKAEALEKLGIKTLEDMICFFPRDYEDRRNVVKIAQLKADVAAVIRGKVDLIVSDRYKYGRKQLLRLLISDDTGALEIVFFNAKYLMSSFKKGEEYIFYGKPQMNFGKLQLVHPEFSRAGEELKGIMPVYPLTKGISQREMRDWQRSLKTLHDKAEDFLAERTIAENRLCSLSYALENIHFPQEKQKLLEARFRLIFDELLVLQTGLLAARQNIQDGKNGIAFSTDVDIKDYTESLPYRLTGAQSGCIKQINDDLESTKVMNRLVQGDVGSGKTAVAEAAMYKAAVSGYQAALMAPTEILARQHFEGISRSFAAHGIEVGFLSGSMKAAEKRETLAPPQKR